MSCIGDENNPQVVNMSRNSDTNTLSLAGTSPPIKMKAQPPVASPPQSLTDAKLAIQSPPVEDALKMDAVEKEKVVEPVEVTPKTDVVEEEVEDFLGNSKKQAAELLIIGGGNTGGATSLQDNFKRFRKQKVKERKIMLMCKEELTTKGPRTREFKDNLRMKFVDQAKKYLGVPYSERYKNPDEPPAPLYLDCCGLVRKVLQDLGEEFGFLIGRWNQAYQFDTLPIRKEGVHELQPGDLIFYEGTYSSERSKSQKHNNVHVEIFLGGETGEATIGARFFKGKVNIFDSYKFSCTTWTPYKHWFCSIETWLDGICESVCPEHPWLIDSGLMLAAAAGKKSIFNEDSDDESAGGFFDDEVVEQFEKDAAAGLVCGPCEISPVPNEALDDSVKDSADLSSKPTDIECNELFLPKRDDSPEPVFESNSAPSSPSGKIKKEKRQRLPPGVEFVAMPPVSQSTTEINRLPAAEAPKKLISKRSEVSKSVDSGSLKSKVDCGVSAKSAGETYLTPSVSANTAGVAEYLPPKGNGVTPPPNTYYVAKANGWRLVKAALDKRGWQQLPFEYQFSSRYGLKFVERRSQIDYRTHQPGQLVCHIPNNEVISTKVGLLSTLRNKFCRVDVGSKERKPTPWMPETYHLDIPADVTAALDIDAQITTDSGKAPIWIYKPSCNNRGRGIKVLSGHDALREVCVGIPATETEEATKACEGIMQRYIENPLLVPRGSDSFKFDYRCYLLVARNDPSYMCFFHPGYCRLTTRAYDDSIENLSDPIIHLTNASLQKKDPDYKANKDFQVQSLESVADRIEAGGNVESANYLRREMHEQIKKCMADIVRASSSKFMRKHGYFDLFGLDFMVTLDNQTLLLEANTNPALSLDNDCLSAILPDMVDGCMGLVLGCQGPDRPRKEDRQDAADAALLDNLPGKWELVHNEKTKYFYSSKKAKESKASASPSKTKQTSETIEADTK